MIKFSLKKNQQHRLAEKYVCQHFDPLIQLRSIYSRTVRELHLPRVRAGSLSTRETAKEDGRTEREKGMIESFEIEGSRIRQARLLMPSRAVIFLSVWENAPKAPKALCSLFNCSSISYSTDF